MPDDCVSPTPRSKIRARIASSPTGHQNDTFVRCGNRGSCSIARADRGQVERVELGDVRDPDRALRVAHVDVLEAAPGDLARAVGAARRERVGPQPRAPHVDAARRGAEDRRADLPGRGLDRELVAVGPAAPAQVEDRLARAVARQLGLRAVRVEDLQPRDEAGRRGPRQCEDAVRARAGVAVAEAAHGGGREREGQILCVDDHVVIPKCLPLLEPHLPRFRSTTGCRAITRARIMPGGAAPRPSGCGRRR